MAYGDYYNPNNKIVTDGQIVYADDLNKINTAVDSALTQVASDLDDIVAGLEDGGVSSRDWASEDQGVRPDPVEDLYSARAYTIEAKGWAVSAGTVLEASTGVALAGSVSAKTSAISAAASAGTATTMAGTATTMAGTATTKANEASASAAAALLSEQAAAASESTTAGYAAQLPNVATSGADKIVVSNAAGDGWEYPTITTAGKALLDDSSASVQRQTLGLDTAYSHTSRTDNPHSVTKSQVGLGNVSNVDNTNADNITSGTLAAARVHADIARLASPTFTGVPAVPTASTGTNTTQAASTAFVVAEIAATSKRILLVQDKKTQGTEGGTSSTGTNTRVLNTVVNNTFGGSPLSSNQITLPAGTFKITASAPCRYSAALSSKLRFYNVTGGTYDIEGFSNLRPSTEGKPDHLIGYVTTTGNTVFELRHYLSGGLATNGLGAAVGQGVEVYASVLVEEV